MTESTVPGPPAPPRCPVCDGPWSMYRQRCVNGHTRADLETVGSTANVDQPALRTGPTGASGGPMPDADMTQVELLSARLHDIYQQEAHRRGDVRHADDYDDLAEETKEWDRVLARWILTHWTPNFDPLTADEHEAMRLSGDLAGLLRRIIGKGNQAEHDWAEAAARIHAVQHMILAQAAARSYPGLYRPLGGWPDGSVQEEPAQSDSHVEIGGPT